MSSESTASPRRSNLPIILAILGTIVLGIAYYAWSTFLAPPPPLRIGRATTFIEGPLLADGRPDYIGYLNQEWSRGVTPENNAAIPLLEALGPNVIPVANRAAYFQLLGVDPPPPDGTFLVFQMNYLQNTTLSGEQIAAAIEQAQFPFTAAQQPELAAWIESSQVPLDRAVQAAERDRFFTPAILPANSPSLFSLTIEEIQNFREIARGLSARSMLRLGSGDVDGACADCLALQRIGRAMSSSPFLITVLVGVAIHRAGADGAEQILLSEKMNADQARRFLDELERVPPPQPIARTLDQGERLGSLQTLTIPNGLTAAGPVMAGPLNGRQIDPNVALPVINGWMDRAVAIMQVENPVDRAARLKVMESEIMAKRGVLTNPKTVLKEIVFGGRRGLSEYMGNVLSTSLMPSVLSVASADDRTRSRQRLLIAAARIELYRAENGRLPESLDDLVPRYGPEVPADYYSGKPLLYQRHADGYLLYSFGPDGVDAAGRNSSDNPGPPNSRGPDDERIGRLPPE